MMINMLVRRITLNVLITYLMLTLTSTMIWSESTIILAIVGMVGLFASAVVYQRANRISSRYYKR